MWEDYHRYQCPVCGIVVVGTTLESCSDNVNVHNQLKHNSYELLTAEDLEKSEGYDPPDKPKALTKYTEPYGTTLTPADRKFLERILIKW